MNIRTLDRKFPLRAALERLLTAARQVGPNSNKDPQLGDGSKSPPLPYPGLRFFTADNSEYFIGRAKQAEAVLNRLADSHTVLILGGSGCGKSSLVRGGVLPLLATSRQLPDHIGPWYSVTMRPERHPVARLQDAFLDQFLTTALDRLRARHAALPIETSKSASERSNLEKSVVSALHTPGSEPMGFESGSIVTNEAAKQAINVMLGGDRLGGDSDGGPAHPGLARLQKCVGEFDKLVLNVPGPPTANLLLVIDQFEELFRSEIDGPERERLVGFIRYVFEFQPDGVIIALVMRSEDLHRCAEEPVLSAIVNTSSIFIDWLGRPELRRAIVEPAQRVFKEWLNLEPSSENRDAPFRDDIVDALLDEADRLKENLEHKGDH
jgi:hypothetical protein